MTTTTTAFRIQNTTSGADLGVYEGETADEAIRAMLADAGCKDEPSDDLVATLVPTEPTHIALYTGPNGPMSVALTCEDTDEACAFVRVNSGYLYDECENALGVPADADDEAIDAALVAQGWRTTATCTEGEWSIHRRA